METFEMCVYVVRGFIIISASRLRFSLNSVSQVLQVKRCSFWIPVSAEVLISLQSSARILYHLRNETVKVYFFRRRQDTIVKSFRVKQTF